jgi:hypothetical protein
MHYGDKFAMIDFGLEPTEVITGIELSTPAAKISVLGELNLSGGLGINSPTSYYQSVGEVYGYTCFGNAFSSPYAGQYGYTDIYSVISNEFSIHDVNNVILISDGDEINPVDVGYNPNNYHSAFDSLKTLTYHELQNHGIRLFPIIIDGHSTSSFSSYNSSHSYFSDLAERTGGAYLYVPRVNHIANVDLALMAAYNQILYDQNLLDWSKRVTPASTQRDTLSILADNSIGQLRFDLNWTWGEGTGGYDHQITLLKPDGTLINQSEPDLGIVYNQDMTSIDSGNRNYVVNTPDLGIWKAVVTRATIPAGYQDDLTVNISAKSTLQLTASLSPTDVHLNNTPELDVCLLNDGQGVNDAQVTVAVEHQAFTGSTWSYPSTTTLTASGSGDYSAILSCFTEIGYYRLTIVAVDDPENPTYRRQQVIDLSMREITLTTPIHVLIQANSTAYNLSWSPVENAEYYNIYYATIPSGPYTLLTNTSDTSLTYPTASLGTKCFFRVTAFAH